MSNVKDTNKIEIVLAEKIREIIYSSEDENPRKYNKNFQMKDLQQALNSVNASLLSLVMSYVGSVFKLLRMSWFISMKQFLTNLNLVINKYVHILHESFPGVDYYSNDIILIEISK